MNVPIKDNEFPRYFKLDSVLLAFVAKDKMFKIEPIGSNKNPGVTIDHYITRNMVLRHFPKNGRGKELTRDEFSGLLEKLYSTYFYKILNW